MVNDSWIFGYGSLIWRPDFDFLERRVASIGDWRRRFWQASPDHRGVPEYPGRVVTLVRETGARCAGVAFRVAASRFDAIIAELDVREQNGYELTTVNIDFADGSSASGLTYIAGPDNPSFVGPDSLAAMAHQIHTAHGPSGANRDYLLQLARHLAEIGTSDDEVVDLAEAVAALGPGPP